MAAPGPGAAPVRPVDGQTVTIYGKGFGPNEYLGIVQCTAEADVDNLGVVGCELGEPDDVYSGVTYADADFGLEPITDGPSEMAVTTTAPPTTPPMEIPDDTEVWPTPGGPKIPVDPEDPDMNTQLAPEPLLPPGVRPGEGTTEYQPGSGTTGSNGTTYSTIDDTWPIQDEAVAD